MANYYKSQHYMAPNVSQFLPTYTNQEQDYIREAFTSASFKSIQKLPTDIRYSSVNEATSSHIEKNLKPGMLGTVLLNKPAGPYFKDFPYMSTPYDYITEVANREHEEHKQKVATISEKPWMPSHANPHTAFNLPPPRFQRTDLALAHNQFYCDPFEDADDIVLRTRWAERSKELAGPFVPAGRGLGVGARPPPKTQLTQILHELKLMLAADWGDCAHEVYADEEGHIIVSFSLATLPSPEGLLAYMTLALNTNEAITQYALSKVPDMWNACVGSNVYFALRPPWLRVRVNRSRKQRQDPAAIPNTSTAALTSGVPARMHHASGPALKAEIAALEAEIAAKTMQLQTSRGNARGHRDSTRAEAGKGAEEAQSTWNQDGVSRPTAQLVPSLPPPTHSNTSTNASATSTAGSASGMRTGLTSGSAGTSLALAGARMVGQSSQSGHSSQGSSHSSQGRGG